MRDDPGLDVGGIAGCLEAEYRLRVASVRFLPIGYDMSAAAYEVLADDGTAYFLKIRIGPIHEPGLQVARTLVEHGVPNVLAPLRTRSAALWCRLGGHSIVLYPFVKGQNAVAVGLSDRQWVEFGETLRTVHDSIHGERIRGRLPVEAFALPSARLVRELL